MNLQLEDNIPLRPRYGARTPVTRALRDMDVGQSFRITEESDWNLVRSSMSRIPPKKFTCRQESGGWRVWRTA